MDKKEFGKIMGIYFSNFGIDIDLKYSSMMCELLSKERIDIRSFEKAVYRVIKINNEEYFKKYGGKKLTFADWLEACGYKNNTSNDIMMIGKKNFLEKLEDRITGFQADFMKKEFNDSLTENESMALKQLGGASDLWERVNREGGFNTSKANVLKEAGQAYENVYRLERNQLMIERKEVNDQTQKMIGSFVKKIN